MNNENFTVGQIRPIECFKEGWELIKSDYWMMFAIALVGFLLGGVTLYILFGAMACGIFICFLQKIDTGTVSFDNLWKGFNYFKPSFIVLLAIVVPTIIVYVLIYAPFIMAAAMGQKLSESEMMGMLAGAFAIDAVVILLMVCFHTLLMFSFLLIVDKNISGMQAMKLSAKAVWKNLGGVAGFIGVYCVIIFAASFLTCGIGVYFILPIITAAFTVVYRKVFPALKQTNFEPPPPNAYSGL